MSASFDVSRSEQLRPWLIRELPKHTNANLEAVTDYVLLQLSPWTQEIRPPPLGPETAADRSLNPSKGLRSQLIEALDHFATDDISEFVDELLAYLRANDYLVTTPARDPVESVPPAVQTTTPTTTAAMSDSAQHPNRFLAMPHPYRLLFLGLEPASLFLPFFLALLYPAWFQHQLIPSSELAPPLGPREVMAIWQLGNCYGLLGLISSFVFRAIRDTLKDDPWAQERIIAASLSALAIADITHILLTLLALPPELRFDVANWNAMTWGNVPVVVVLFAGRMAWFAGIGRTSYLKQKVS